MLKRLQRSRAAGLGAIAAIAVLSFSVSAVIAANGQSDRSPAGPRAANPVPKPTTPSVSDGQAALGVLGRKRTADDELPAATREVVDSHASLSGENFDLARRALVTSSGLAYYVIPGSDDEICLRSESGAGACTTLAEVKAGHFIGVELCAAKLADGWFRVTGMVPNGVANVTVRRASGAEESVRVSDNVYSLTTANDGDHPVSVSWPGLAKPTAVNVPSDVEAGCGPRE